jgi:alpha-L-fucosidase
MGMPIPQRYISDFENMGFGMFVHFGLYSQECRGEKIRYFEKIPMEEYRKLADTFTASKFDGRKIARFAKANGANYITLTTRHHDGFSLYDTRGLSDFDITHAACKRDLIADFIEGCRAEGVAPFLYHTTLDWHMDSFVANFKEYIGYLFSSIEILCKNYGTIGGLWFDGNWSRNDVDWEEDRLYKMIRSHQPNAVLVNNSGIRKRGAVGHPELDAVTFENGHPTPMNREGMPKYIASEMNHTMNHYWGYAKGDVGYQSSTQLIESLCNCRKVGANYLLNIGPDGDGDIVPMQKALFSAVGQWIHASKAPIYSGRPNDIDGEGSNFSLDADGKSYLFVFNLTRADSDGQGNGVGNGVNSFTGVKKKVTSVTWCDNDEELAFVQDGEKLDVTCTGFGYGHFLVVRVAEITFE